LSNKTLHELRVTMALGWEAVAYPPSTSCMNVSREASARV
jgi:hypothetical protein